MKKNLVLFSIGIVFLFSEGRSVSVLAQEVGSLDKSADQKGFVRKKRKTKKRSPRNPASSPEVLSGETVEYLKNAGKKVERIFEPVSHE